ncbi:MAG: DUF4347 domain-containing protein, partial [Rhodoferax sp.]|uniref:DUF4347 domain-containing protein n=1 Tax=Rhodoferax sp. TaxID=50421 RepID=UPI002733C064
MNHLYRSVWNDITRTFVAVAENVKQHGKSVKSDRSTGSLVIDAEGPGATHPPGTLRRLVTHRPQLLALEPRLVFDGAALETFLAADTPAPNDGDDATAQVTKQPATFDTLPSAAPVVLAAGHSERKEVVFIDARVIAPVTLLPGFADAEVVQLQADSDGLTQIADYLAQRSDLDAIHLLSHGTQGSMLLGNTLLDSASLASQTQQLERIGSALGADGDILLYGCDVAAGPAGESFVNQIAAITRADVAASDDATGVNGDWVLEYQAGPTRQISEADQLVLTSYQADLVTYAATLDTNSPTYVRDGGTGSFYYATQNITASATEPWVFEVTSLTADSYLALYSSFDSANPLTNLLASNDDGGAGTQARVLYNVTNGSTYTLVLSTFAAGTTGSFSFETRPNAAPALDANQSPVLTAIAEDALTNTGTTVADIVVNSSITDTDGGFGDRDTAAVEAIVVETVDNSNGTWQYSLNAGSSWTGIPTGINDAFGTGLLLDATDTIRFVPNANFNGDASFTFHAWDKADGRAPGTQVSFAGGTSAGYSSASDTASISVTAVNDAPTLPELENNLVQQATSTSIAFSDTATAIKGLASDGVYLYVNDAGQRIEQYDAAGTQVSSNAVLHLPGDANQLAYSQGYLFARNGANLYRISTTDWTSTAVTVPSDKLLLDAQIWMTGSLFSLPDGRLGTTSARDGSGNTTVRLYNLSADGLTLTFSQDLVVNDPLNDFPGDHHGTVSDGRYLYIMTNTGGYKAYDLSTGQLAYNGTGWNMANPTLGTGGNLVNVTYLTRDPLSGALIAGDYSSYRIVQGASSAATISLIGAATGTPYTITFDALAGAAAEADVDGDALAFRIEAVNAGTLTKGGNAVVAGETLLSAGDSLVWTPAINTGGTFGAFSVKAWDGALASIQATVVSVRVSDVPEIDVRGNSTPIADGDTTPSSTDHTDFGAAVPSASSVSRTFTIANTGAAALSLSGSPLVSISGADAGQFSVITQPSSTIARGTESTFAITFTPTSSGAKTATVSITSNDGDEGTYDFVIQGQGNVAPSFTQVGTSLLYETTTPTFTSFAPTYALNNASSFGSTPISRIGYRMEMNTTEAPNTPYYAEVWFDAWAGVTAADLAVPTGANAITIQRDVTNLSVSSNYAGVTNGTALAGRLEIWPYDYGTTGGDSGKYDYSDTSNGGGSYGSFQVFNMSETTPQTVFAWNSHNNIAGPDLGLGNQPSSHPDWTFAGTATFRVADWKLQILAETGTSSLTVTEDQATNLTFGGTPFADADGNSLTVTLSVVDGTLTGNAGTGVTLGGSATARTFSGSAADLNTYFTTAGYITYTTAQDNTASRTLTVDVSDGMASSSDTVSISVTPINDAPSLSGTSVSQPVNDTATVSPFANVQIADPDTGASLSASITLDAATKGTFTAASLTASGFSTADNGTTYTHPVATPAALQTAIRQLVFQPSANRVAPGGTETTTFTLSVSDGVADAVTDSVTSVVSTSVNEAPNLAAPTAGSLIDTTANDSFGNITGTLVGSDVDRNIAPVTPRSYFKLDETSGTTPADSGTNTTVANFSGTSPIWSSDVPGVTSAWNTGSLDFTGVNDGFQSANNLDFAQTAPRTFSLWYKPVTAGTEGGGYSRIMGWTNDYFDIAEDSSSRLLRFYDGSGWHDTSLTMTVGTWYHITSTFDGTTIKFFDGNTAIYSAAWGGKALSGNMYLGMTHNGGEASNGLIDDVRVYDFALDATQIAALTAGSASIDISTAQTLTYGIDGGTVASGTSTLAGTYGSLAVNSTSGAYTYTPNATAINALSANAADTFTVNVSDGTANTSQTYTVNLTAANDTPTLTSISTITGGAEDTEKTITVADLQTAGDAVDVDGTVSAFVVHAVSTGTLKIGTDAASATAWAEGSNDTIDTSHSAYWTGATDVNGTLSAFTAVAKDNAGLASNTAIQVSVNVAASNDAPTSLGNLTLVAVDEDTTDPTGVAISSLTGLAFADVDASASLAGVAVVGNTANATTEGVWQYSSDAGAHWFAIGTVANDATALALSAGTQLRFVPVANYNGTPPVLAVRALDNTYTSGFSASSATETRVTLDAAVNGDSTAIAASSNTIGTSITAVNDAPTLTSITTLSGTAITTSFDEGSLIPALGLDVPNSTVANITLDMVNGELDFSAASNSDMWGSRNNAPIAWVAAPSVAVGATWSVETLLRSNNTAQAQVSGITFYGNADGAVPDFTFGLDTWNSPAAIRLQGLGDGNPDVGATYGDSAVYLKVDITRAATSNDYSFYYKKLAGDDWTLLTTLNSSLVFSRVGLVSKTSGATDGVAFSQFSVNGGAFLEDQSSTIRYADLVAAANATDIEGSPLSFRIEAVSSGTLTHNGNAVTSGVTLITSADSVVWTPAQDANGALNAFTVKAWDGALASSSAMQVAINVQAVNDAPALVAGSTTAFTEQTPVIVASGLTLSDADGDADWNGGTLQVQISANSESTDTLSLPTADPGTSGIWLDSTSIKTGSTVIGTASAASVSGSTVWILTFNASATNTLVQATARAISFNNPGDAPSTSSRTVSFTATDKNAGAVSATQTISITAVNDAPTGLGNLTLVAVDEDTTDPTGVAISSLTGLAFADVDASASLAGVAVVGNTANTTTEGVWQYSSDAGAHWFDIGTVANDATALALSASTQLRFVPAANYNGTPPALTVRALDNTYTSGFSASGTTETRVTLDAVLNGGATAVAASSNSIGTSITVVNDKPTLSASATLSYQEGDAAAPLDANLTLGDTDDTQLAGATVTLTSVVAGDVLEFADQNGITGSYNASTGVLTLSGTATLAHYQTALRSVSFRSTSEDPSVGGTRTTRDVQWVVTDVSGADSIVTLVASYLTDTSHTLSSNGTDPYIITTDLGQNWTFEAEYLLTTNTDNATATVFSYGWYSEGVLLRAWRSDGFFVPGASTNTDLFASANTNGAYVPVKITSSHDGTTGTVNVYVSGVLQETLTFTGDLSPADKSIRLGSAHHSSGEGLAGAVRNIRITAGTTTVTTQVSITAINDAPTLSTFSGAVDSVNEDTQVELILADLKAQGDESDVDGSVSAFVVQAVSTGTLKIGTSAGAATAWAAGSNDTIDATLHAYWTGDQHANGNQSAFTVKAWDGALASSAAVQVVVDVAAVNDAPTITAGSTTAFTEQTLVIVASGLTLSDVDGDTDWNGGTLAVQISANSESSDTLSLPSADPGAGGIWLDGSSIKTGSTVIGTANAASVSGSTAWTLTFNASATNALVQATARAVSFNNPGDAPSTSSRTISFTATDKNAAVTTASQTLSITAVNDAPTLSTVATLGEGTEDTEKTITLADLQSAGNEADVDGTVSAFVVQAVSTGSLKIGTSAEAATAWAQGNDTIDASHHAYWSGAENAHGTLSAFTVVAQDNGGLQSDTARQVSVTVSAVNDAPTLTVPSELNVAGATSTGLTGLVFADVDAGTGTLSASFSVNVGSLSAVSAGGVTVGGSATLLTLSGSLADLNSYLAAGQLAFTAPNLGGATTATLRAEISDQGASGSGGAKSSPTAQITLNIAAPLGNTAPVLSGASGTLSALAGQELLRTSGGYDNNDYASTNAERMADLNADGWQDMLSQSISYDSAGTTLRLN